MARVGIGGGAPQASSGTTSDVNLIEVGGVAVATGNGTVTGGTIRITVASDTSWTPTVLQGTSPWVVSGTVAVTQSTSPWVVSSTDLDIRNLVFATDKVDVSGSTVTSSISGTVAVTQSTSPWVISGTDLDIRDLVFATDKVDVSGSAVSISGTVAVTQSTSPWVISGSVTANAGTNLNTSLLALESGGNLAASAASLSVLDDWDESDRAKVNIIVGQAGVQGGSGTVSANTQRVVLATDVALPTGSNVIGAVTQSGSWTVAVSGTVGVTQSTSPWVVSNGGTFAVQAAQSGTWTVQPGNTANTTPWLVSSKTALTASSPTAATVGTSSASAVASNANRKGLVLINTSNNTISLGLGATAVLSSGITLSGGGGTWVMDEFTFTTAAINAIASAVSSNLAIQEFT